MPLTREQIERLADQVTQLAAIVAPGHAAAVATLRGLVAAGTTLHGLIARVRAEDPEAWAEIAKDFNASHASLQAAIAAADARDGTPDA